MSLFEPKALVNFGNQFKLYHDFITDNWGAIKEAYNDESFLAWCTEYVGIIGVSEKGILVSTTERDWEEHDYCHLPPEQHLLEFSLLQKISKEDNV